MSRRPVDEGHGEDCLCPPCCLLDMEAHLRAQGRDTARFWDGVPATMWERMPAAAREQIAAGGYNEEPEHVAAFVPAPPVQVELPPAERPAVPVPVYCLHVGAWARLTGTDRHGAPLVVTGAIIAGPDEYDADNSPRFAVLVRTYRAGEPDVVVWVPEDTPAELVDDQAVSDEHTAQTLAPVYAPGAQRVDLYRRTPGTKKQADRWELEHHDGVSAEQLAAWEHGGTDVRLSAVYRHHAPIPAGAL